MDRRWQLVLDCIDCENAPFSQATLARFRTALIIQALDRRPCAICPLKERCTTSKIGRSVSIHPDEPLFYELTLFHHSG